MDSKKHLRNIRLFQASYCNKQEKVDDVDMKSMGFPFNFIQVSELTLEALQREG